MKVWKAGGEERSHSIVGAERVGLVGTCRRTSLRSVRDDPKGQRRKSTDSKNEGIAQGLGETIALVVSWSKRMYRNSIVATKDTIEP